MLIKIKEAKKIIFEKVKPLGTKLLSLNQANGFCLAEKIFADRDFPPADRSAMDGFAVRSEDAVKVPCKLKIIGEAAAGTSTGFQIEKGSCTRIFTGANLPKGADTVVKIEDTEEEGNIATILSAAPAGLNIRYQGEDIKKGQTVVKTGKVLGAAQIGICASVGKNKVKIFLKPKVSVLTTGKELVSTDSDKEIKDFQIRDSNGPALNAALKMSGFNCFKVETATDDPVILKTKLENLVKENDVVILSGGVSMGKYDFVPEVVKEIGGEIQVHKILMKPGKPFLYASLGENKHIFGLPGNPLSVITSFYEFVLPTLKKLSGYFEEECSKKIFLPVARTVRSRNFRTKMFLAKLKNIDGKTVVELIESKSSGDLSSSAEADGVFSIEPDTEIKEGELAEFTFWR